MRRWRMVAGLWLALAVLLMAPSPDASAVGGCTPDCGSPPTQPSCSQQVVSWPDGCGGTCTATFNQTCSAPDPACDQTTYGTWTCGSQCSRTGPPCCTSDGSCTAPAPTCAQQTTTGVDNCGNTCTRTFNNYCNAPAPACGQTTTGSYVCGGACSLTGPSCSVWVPYGYVIPGDPVYGFPNLVDAGGNPVVPDPSTRDLLGLAAKGNIILGNYTDPAFVGAVLPSLSARTQAYAIDPTDADLGYHTGDGGVMYDAQGRPLFDGNYDQQDMDGAAPGTKMDGSPRRFYESTLTDAEFQALMAQYGTSGTITLDGVLFTNHAIAGLAPSSLTINGSMVARDDGILFSGSTFRVNHDNRILGDQASQEIALPMSVRRPTLLQWSDCPPSGCL